MLKSVAGGLAALLMMGAASAASAAESVAVPDRDWSFEGVFGTFDQAQLQRGLQVHQNVCGVCHGLRQIRFRELSMLGYSEEEIKAFAAQYQVQNEEPNEFGETFMRPARPSDSWPSPFPNEQAARAANGGAYPPDLSLIIEARAGGADYLHALLTGYKDVAPEGFELQPGLYYNEYYPGHQIGMPQPLYPESVPYQDGTEATVEQMVTDVAAFLTWAAEPNLEYRKQTGIKVILFLLVFTGILIAVKKRIWASAH